MTSILDSNFIFCCYFLLLFELLLELKLRVKRFDRNEIYFAESGENSKWKSFLYPMIWNRPVVGMLTVLFCLVFLSLSLSLFHAECWVDGILKWDWNLGRETFLSSRRTKPRNWIGARFRWSNAIWDGTFQPRRACLATNIFLLLLVKLGC